MALSEQELEKQLTEAGKHLLSHPSSVSELVNSLDRVENLLTRVEQSPSDSMRKALSPSMKALVSNELLRHSDVDVNVSVASCISEITRITAPDAPYEDEQMKEVFQLIVSSFENLDDKSSPSYFKRTSILETVAKVRSCVVMLDLECDALIVEMFKHFFKSIRNEHPENVFSSMETIMTLVLEESEDVSVDLLSPILDVLKPENKEILPVARLLGEKVTEKCATKLKPYLLPAIKSHGTTIADYSKVVANVLQMENEAVEPSDVDAASKNVADENDVANAPSEKAVEVALETLEDAPPSEETGPAAITGSPKAVVSNGVIQKEVEDTSTGVDNPKEENNAAHAEAEPNKSKVNSDAEQITKSRTKREKASKRKGRKTNSVKSSSEPTLVDGKEGKETLEPEETERKDDNNAQSEAPVADSAEPAENKKGPAENKKGPAESKEESAEHHKEPAENQDEPAESKDEPAESKDEPAESKDEPAESKDEPAESKDEPAESKDEPVESKDEPVKSKDEPVKSKDEPAESKDEPAESKDEPAESKDEPVESKDEPVKSKDEPVKSKDEPAGSKDEPDESKDERDESKDEPAENKEKPEATVPSPKTSDEPVDVPSPSPSGSRADETRLIKAGKGKKKNEMVESVPADVDLKKESDKKKPSEGTISQSKSKKRKGKKVSSAADKDESVPSSADASKKEGEKASELNANSAKQSSKKVELAASQSDDKKKKGHGKGNLAKDLTKTPAKDEGKKSTGSVKSTAKSVKDDSDAEKASKSSSKRKRTSESDKTSKYGKELVGSKVKVWWPDDKKYYEGVVELFDSATGKHKVLYNDGDVETLKLEKEKWKLIEGVSALSQGQLSDEEIPDEATETPKVKKAKTSPVQGAKQGKTEPSSKKAGASSSKSKATPKSQTKLKGDKGDGKAKDETLKSIAKSGNDKSGKTKESSKSGSKTSDKTAGKSASKSKGSKEKPAVLAMEDDSDVESSPEPAKEPEIAKVKSQSASKSKTSAKKRKRSTKG